MSDEAELLTGYKRKEAIGKNVALLMPAFVGDSHDKCLRLYLDRGKSHLIDQQRDLFFVHKSGYFYFVTFLLKMHPSVNGRLMFVGFMKKLQTNTDLI